MHFSKQIVNIAEFHHWEQFEENSDKELLVISLADALAKELEFIFFPKKNESKTPELEEGDVTLEETDKDPKLDHDQFIKDLSDLSALKILALDPEKVFSIIEQIHPMINETSRAF
jgi:hypothetical protein